jgi:hypothetical protein
MITRHLPNGYAIRSLRGVVTVTCTPLNALRGSISPAASPCTAPYCTAHSSSQPEHGWQVNVHKSTCHCFRQPRWAPVRLLVELNKTNAAVEHMEATTQLELALKAHHQHTNVVTFTPTSAANHDHMVPMRQWQAMKWNLPR